MKQAVDSWRQMLLEQMSNSLHKQINQMADRLMLKVMDMMKVRLRYLHDIKNHTYLFTEPDYETDLGQKFQKKIKQVADVNAKILGDMVQLIKEIDSKQSFTAEIMNRVCSEYLFKEKIYNNEDVFYLIRFALSGNQVGAPMADIAEVIGKQQVE